MDSRTMRFEGRVAVVTGGAAGIGRATAVAFANITTVNDDEGFYAGVYARRGPLSLPSSTCFATAYPVSRPW